MHSLADFAMLPYALLRLRARPWQVELGYMDVRLDDRLDLLKLQWLDVETAADHGVGVVGLAQHDEVHPTVVYLDKNREFLVVACER